MIARNGNIAKSLDDAGPTDIEALLPWHAVGRLAPKDARAVEDALRQDPALARQFAVIQDEVTETIHLNESLGTPSARAMQKLMTAIDAEPARTASASATFWARVNAFIATLSPKALAFSAAAAAVLVLLQAGVIGTLITQSGSRSDATFRTASSDEKRAPEVAAVQAPRSAAPSASVATAPRALVTFAPAATMADITAFLTSYNASIISGPQSGMFRVQFGNVALPADEAARLVSRIQNEKVVSLAVASD